MAIAYEAAIFLPYADDAENPPVRSQIDIGWHDILWIYTPGFRPVITT